jgi:hypothetical protein
MSTQQSSGSKLPVGWPIGKKCSMSTQQSSGRKLPVGWPIGKGYGPGVEHGVRVKKIPCPAQSTTEQARHLSDNEDPNDNEDAEMATEPNTMAVSGGEGGGGGKGHGKGDDKGAKGKSKGKSKGDGCSKGTITGTQNTCIRFMQSRALADGDGQFRVSVMCPTCNKKVVFEDDTDSAFESDYDDDMDYWTDRITDMQRGKRRTLQLRYWTTYHADRKCRCQGHGVQPVISSVLCA